MSDMTSAVAIDLLDNLIGMFDDNQENDYDSALHMAINALKAQSDGNTISRQDAIDAVSNMLFRKFGICGDLAEITLAGLPSAQPDRDIPVKPVETTDKTWGIPLRQAVCPKCDYYLGHVAFLGDYKGKRITYCETCGQAIDWEGWEFDE